MLEIFFGFIALCLISLIFWSMGSIYYTRIKSPFCHSVTEKMVSGVGISVCIVFIIGLSYLLGTLILKLF